MTSYEIPVTLAGEINNLGKYIEAFVSNKISDTELKARRVPFGIYEQRTKGTFMMRVRCPAGIITPNQLLRVSELSKKFTPGILHISTRQEIQIHDVKLNDIVPILNELLLARLSTRGGGGNTVRNITASWDSGISKNEVFDVHPYAVALTTKMTAMQNSWLLPRKFKIAFSNNPNDTAFATVTDVGFIAAEKNGEQGFRVYVAGGLGRMSERGHLLHDFIPAGDFFSVAESVKRLFSIYGNRKNKHSARLRFLWKTLGREKFTEKYNDIRTDLQKNEITSLPVIPIKNETVKQTEAVSGSVLSSEFDFWKKYYVHEQKQPGEVSVKIPIQSGMISADKMILLAKHIEEYGENTIRFTLDQNITLRNIPETNLESLFAVIKKITSLAVKAPFFGNAVACAGASTCQLGICLSRGALNAVYDRLLSSDIAADTLAGIKLNISGCPNSCGQHQISDIGFFGKASRMGEHSYPAYSIVAGSRISGDKTVLAEKIDEISAHDLPAFLEDIFRAYEKSAADYNSFTDYIEAEGKDAIKKIAGSYRPIPDFAENKNYYFDWGSESKFSVAGRGTGECASGVFDIIDIDRKHMESLEKTIESSPTEDSVYALVLAASRMLLVTRGIDTSSENEIFSEFKRQFIESGLVGIQYSEIIDKAIRNDRSSLFSSRNSVLSLSRDMNKLYATLDDSLQFHAAFELKTESLENRNPLVPDQTKNLRGVACPMNFVKTKVALSSMKSGELLEVLLDNGAPVENVPKSVELEGHKIETQEPKDGFWSVLIRKA